MQNILTIPAQGCTLGLTLWYTAVLPSLLPFFILSGLLVRTGAFRLLNRIFAPVLTRIFRVSTDGSYAILMGYLCGFPMGAKVIAELVEQHHISREEGSYLLVFCNNVSPSFFVNYICIAKLGFTKVPAALFCVFYGIPLLYGCLYGHFFYKAPVSRAFRRGNAGSARSAHTDSSLTTQKQAPIHRIDFPMLDTCIMDSFATITRLGGYIILFSVFAQMLTLWNLPAPLTAAIAALLEISSGAHALSSLPIASAPLRTALVCMGASFGGLCTCAQIASVLPDSRLNLRPWITGRILLPLLTFLTLLPVLFLQAHLPALHGCW